LFDMYQTCTALSGRWRHVITVETETIVWRLSR
jgi:hypothetical protein